MRNRTSVHEFGPLRGVGSPTHGSDRVPGRRAVWALDLARVVVGRGRIAGWVAAHGRYRRAGALTVGRSHG